jgi:hypothetical protein
MSFHVRSTDLGSARWLRHGADRLRRALSALQRLLGLDHRHEALAPIPIRATRLPPSRKPRRHTLLD